MNSTSMPIAVPKKTTKFYTIYNPRTNKFMRGSMYDYGNGKKLRHISWHTSIVSTSTSLTVATAMLKQVPHYCNNQLVHLQGQIVHLQGQISNINPCKLNSGWLINKYEKEMLPLKELLTTSLEIFEIVKETTIDIVKV